MAGPFFFVFVVSFSFLCDEIELLEIMSWLVIGTDAAACIVVVVRLFGVFAMSC